MILIHIAYFLVHFTFVVQKEREPLFNNISLELQSQNYSSCHDEQNKKRHGSHHHKAMADTRYQTIMGDFNNQTFKNTVDGIRTMFFMKGKSIS